MATLNPTWCKHYQARREGNVCKKGVNYDELAIDMEKGFFHSAPCFYRNHANSCLCPLVEYPSQEELQKDEYEIQAVIKRTMVVIPLIDEAAKSAPSGTMECPCCKTGALYWSKASYNGHRRARCTTEGCINFME